MAEKTTKTKKEKKIVNTVPTRGRIFEGVVIKKFATRVVIGLERTSYVHKYERFFKKRSKIHARLPLGMDVQLGDLIRVQECRPLSKIIHAVVISKVRSSEEKK